MDSQIPRTVLDLMADVDSLVSSPEFSHWKRLRSLGLSPDAESLIPAWEEWDRQSDYLSRSLSMAEASLATAEARHSEASSELGVASAALDFHLETLTHVMEVSKEALAGALTWAYRTVFRRPDWSVLIDLEDWRGRKRLSMRVGSEARGWYRLDDLGGSSVFVLGVVVECYYLLYSGLARVIFFDESLSALSQGHLERFLQVLRYFSDSLGFSFLIIDHAPHRFEGCLDGSFTIREHPDGGNVWVSE